MFVIATQLYWVNTFAVWDNYEAPKPVRYVWRNEKDHILWVWWVITILPKRRQAVASSCSAMALVCPVRSITVTPRLHLPVFDMGQHEKVGAAAPENHQALQALQQNTRSACMQPVRPNGQCRTALGLDVPSCLHSKCRSDYAHAVAPHTAVNDRAPFCLRAHLVTVAV